MRITSSTLGGTNNDEITVIRGALGTLKENHDNGSLIRKINPPAIEFRRPSIIRASGHTFEYLGYGPGNYSTGLPQIQVTTLSDQEEYLAQAQKRSAGSVLYTGMNSRGDFYIGNNRVNSTTGEQEVFDVPVPTVTGANPAKLSAVFDEVTIKGRLLVEGGDSGNILSQFDGPVTFNEQTRYKAIANFNNEVRITNEKPSTSSANGALTVRGGVGIQENLNVGGTATITGLLNTNTGLRSRNIRIGITEANTIDTTTGNLILDSTGGNLDVNDNLRLTGNLLLGTQANKATITYPTNIARTLTIPNVSGNRTFAFINEAQTFTGNQSFSNNISVTGTSTFTGSSTFNGSSIFNNTSTFNSAVGVNANLTLTGNLLLGTQANKATITYPTDIARTLTIPNVSGNRTFAFINEAQTFTGTQTFSSTISGSITGNAGSSDLIKTRSTATSANFFLTFVDSNNGSATNEILYTDGGIFYNPSTNNFFVTGDITAFASDDRLKENIEPIESALDKVLSLSGFTYNFNETGQSLGFDGSIRYVGVSAQEVQKVLPEAVKPAPADENYITVQYEKLVPLLIEAIKELKEEINELKGLK
jgi:hypothetical protein